MSQASSGPTETESPPTGKELFALGFAALGVVYGDIGTSVLYALKECFHGIYSVEATSENVLGVLSLIFWSLNFIISFKYLGFMMRADNRGEGGVLALLALLRPRVQVRGGRWLLIMAGLFGSALLYGDGIITPAISVLGAVEGLAVAAPALESWIVWISVAIIIALFGVQRFGTATVGKLFGPITLVWFVSIAILGVHGIIQEPRVLQAVSPHHAFIFMMREGQTGFLVLAAVVLVVTGGEALYADMGHFGKRPIRLAWFWFVLPALVLNYFGQGALLLRNPAAAVNPFYTLVPEWALYPMIGIATAAAVVASQALISGAFSLTQQAVQLGYCPRVNIIHTSHSESGQIYIPEVNYAIGVACVGLVLGFRGSSALAATYGVAVSGTMAVTTILFCAVALERWHWPVWKVAALGVTMLAVDLSFLIANMVKIPHGGWFPLVVAGIIFVMMSTWKRGRFFLAGIMRKNSLPIDLFLADIARSKPVRVPGTAVFMTSDLEGAPPVLLHHLKHNKVLHERVLMMSFEPEDVPMVWKEDRVEIKPLTEGFQQVLVRYGFMETPSMTSVLREMEEEGLTVKLNETTFYLGRETLLPTGKSKMTWWRKRLFIIMTRNARTATAFFGLPPNRVVEMGAQIQL